MPPPNCWPNVARDVAVLDREGSDGKSVAEGLGGAFYPVDVTDFTGTEETLQTAVDKLGGLHVVVTTAGGGIAKRTLTKSGPHDLESFQSVIDLNLIATFNISRLAAAHMAKNEPEDEERGVIINTASIAAFEGQIGQVAYTAAKAGIAGMCLTMARDLGSMGIRVLAIAPSLFLTGLTAMVPDEMAATLTKDAAFPKRMGRPDGVRQAGGGHRGQPDAQRPMHAAGRRTAVRAQVDTPAGALPALSTLFRQPPRFPSERGRRPARSRRCGPGSGARRAPMGIALTDDHRELAEVARAFLTSQKARWAARSLLDAPDEARPGFWQNLVELGWLGLHVERRARRLRLWVARTRGGGRRTRSRGGAGTVRTDRDRVGGDRQRRYR